MELDNYNFKDWIELSVDDLGEIKTGSTPPKSRPEFYGIDHPFYKPTDLNAGYGTRTSIDGLSELGIQNARFFPENSILITCIGATIGKVGIIRKAGACNQQINAIVPYERLLNPNFIYFQTIAPKFQKEIKNNASATTLPILNKGKFAKLSFYICPISEQGAIVSKIEQLFSDLDNGIDNFKKAQAQLKLYRQSVLKAACEGKLVPTEAELARAEGRDYEAADVLLARILKVRREKWNGRGKYKEPVAADINVLPTLPAGWCWTRFEELLIELKNGYFAGTPNSEPPGLPILRINAVRPLSVSFNDLRYLRGDMNKAINYQLRNGDLLFTRYNGSLEFVGACGMVRRLEIPIIYPDKLIRARVFNESITPDYLELYFTTKVPRHFIESTAKSTAGQQGIAGRDLRSIPVAFPPHPEQHRIVTEVERLLSLCDKMETTISESLQKAESLRQSILKKAFEGKLLNEKELEEARNAPDWEPAEKLLEGIKAEKTSTQAKKKGKK